MEYWSVGVMEYGSDFGPNSILQHSITPIGFRGFAMFEDLRGFLAHLESQRQLLRVKDEVDVKYEIAAGMRKTSDIEGPALLFENVRRLSGLACTGRFVRDAKARGARPRRAARADARALYDAWKISTSRRRSFPRRRARKSNGPAIRSTCPSCRSSPTRTKTAVPTSPSACRSVKSRHRHSQSVHPSHAGARQRSAISLGAGGPPSRPHDFDGGGEEKGIGGRHRNRGRSRDRSRLASASAVRHRRVSHRRRRCAARAVKLTKCETIDVEVPALAEVVIEGVTIPGERVAGRTLRRVSRLLQRSQAGAGAQSHRNHDAQESDLADRAHRHAGDGESHA